MLKGGGCFHCPEGAQHRKTQYEQKAELQEG